MKPMELEIAGWGPYKQVQKIDFVKIGERGLFLVTGPTGAGKTTIFDAISFALYGNLSGQTREKNSVRSDFADKDAKTYVNLKMEHKGAVYQIYRNPEYMRPKRRKTGAEAYTKERENAILTMPDGSCIEGAVEVTKKIQEILALDYRQFKQISMIAQGEFAKLLTEAPAEKVRIFRELFGTSMLEQFAANLRTRANGLYKEVMEYRHRMDEDVKLLHEESEAWQQLTGQGDSDYEAIIRYLGERFKACKQKKKELDRLYEEEEKEEQEVTLKLAGIQKWKDTKEKLSEKEKQLSCLLARKQEHEEKEEQISRLRKAQLLEPDYIRLLHAREQHTKQKQELERLAKEKERLVLCMEEDALFFEKRESISLWIEKGQQLEQLHENLKKNRVEQAKEGKELSVLQEAYVEAEKKEREGREKLEEAEAQYRRSAIGIAAKLLEPGKPCPVCGSVEHPAPACSEENLMDEKQLKELRKHHERFQKEMLQVHEKALQIQARIHVLEQEQEVLTEKQKELAVGREKEQGEFAFTSLEGLSYQEKKKTLEKKVTGYQKNQTLLLEKQKAETTGKEELTCLSSERTELEETFKQALLQQKLGEEQDLQDCLSEKADVEKLTEECRHFKEQVVSVQDMIAHLKEEVEAYERQNRSGDSAARTEDSAARAEDSTNRTEDNAARTEPAYWEERLWVCRQAKSRTEEERSALNGKLMELQNIRQHLKDKQERRKILEEEYGIVKDLDNLASGNNSRRLVFEQYVLSAYFEQVLAAANVRFRKMTGGRYEMFRSEQVLDGRSKDSLEICVMDYYTGKSRPVKTLSGGETFKASLALALGLSDVAGNNHGGIRVETLFIDEGFGALDSESLEQACEALTSLVEKEKLIGIISHVPELRERIDNQIVICKTNSGSTIQNVLG